MTERTVHLTGREARVMAHALAYGRLSDDGWLDWEDYPLLDEDSWALVADCVELIGEQLLEHAYEMVDDVDEVDAVLQRAEQGGE